MNSERQIEKLVKQYEDVVKTLESVYAIIAMIGDRIVQNQERILSSEYLILKVMKDKLHIPDDEINVLAFGATNKATKELSELRELVRSWNLNKPTG